MLCDQLLGCRQMRCHVTFLKMSVPSGDVFGRQAVLRRLLLTNDGIADERSNTSLKMQDAD